VPEKNPQETALQQEGAKIQAVVPLYRDFRIQNAEGHVWACAQLVEVKKQIKAFDEQKKTATQPMNQALKAIRSWFAAVETPLEALEKVLKDKIGVYEREERDKQTKALASASVAFQAGDTQRGLAIMQAMPEAAVEKQAGVSSRTVVKFRIVNHALVPREYCAPVEALIRARVAVDKLGAAIPGVEVYEESEVRASTK
jgi:hypothetical protein